MIGNNKINENDCKMETSHLINDCLCIKEKCAQDIENKSKTLELAWNENKGEHVFKDCNTLGRHGVDYIKSWF